MNNNEQHLHFENAKEVFIKKYLDKKFPADLQELYSTGVPNVIGVLRAGFLIGIEFAKIYYKIEG